uniref:DUF1640 domain-containing protein n=1 Tax=Candidatus Kentrum sp. UNK TaxID=2126344 RepID=A0A451AQ55_9GAMM|nr:MAG: hypothetical protein BECKUNK1418G_GA0071005_12025 [Candidatus Kentron sp. UNK]VFK73404.1 MAG: hypothetical protein BECKUNK1418H_GA0071006_11975 [Candidatus Kentron sp. UNK]
MSAITFDTQEYVESLTGAEVPEPQAKAHGKALRSVMASQELATKADVRELKTELKAEIAVIQGELGVFRWLFGLLIGLNCAILFKLFL